MAGTLHRVSQHASAGVEQGWATWLAGLAGAVTEQAKGAMARMAEAEWLLSVAMKRLRLVDA